MASLEIQINKIEGYEDILPRYWINKEGQITNKETGKTIKWLISRHGYYYCHLWANNGNRYIRMHRLLALAFIPNPNNYPLVRHLNDIKTDNRLENLAWGTMSENMKDSIKNGKYNQEASEKARNIGRKISNTKCSKKVLCIETNTIFDNTKEAGDWLGVDRAGISGCCRGKYKTIKGYHWKYVEEDRNGIED